MRRTEEFIIFILCMAVGLTIVSTMGIGGDQFSDLQFWGSITGWAWVIGAAGSTVIITIITAYGLSGARVLGSGPGHKLPEAAALALFAGLYGAFVGWFASIINKLPYLDWIGTGGATIFTVIALVIFLLDISNRVTTQSGGGGFGE